MPFLMQHYELSHWAEQRDMATKPCTDTKCVAPAYHSVHEDPRIPLYGAHALLYSLAIILLVYHRTASLTAAPTFVSSSLFFCLLVAELVLAFMWACSQAFRWRPVRRVEHPDRLPCREEWPALDVFVCTADPNKEPPVGVASTALSLMAFDYPAEKLSVYVSDDGGSDVTLFAFMEAARFARHWLPFCRENGIRERSPEAFFASDCVIGSESQKLKIMYQIIKDNIEKAMQKGCVSSDLLKSSDEFKHFKKWKGFARNNHPTVIQVLLDSNRDKDIRSNTLPNLIYVSREKRPSSPHHFKAGALNVLTRVSSVLTDAPVILTVDCDMSCTDPETPSRALCYFLDPLLAPNLAFVQFPQLFQGLNKNDIYGGAIKYVFTINARGMDGLRGPNYVGSNTFHSRGALHGPSAFPHDWQSLSELQDHNGTPKVEDTLCSEIAMARVLEVASCEFELGTRWGSTVGFRYGSLVEDYYTGYRLHCEGWTSVFCDPAKPAFMGDAPKCLHDVLSQCKRWIVGLYEVAFSRHCTLTFGTRNASLPMGLCYSCYAFWGIWCVPITTYALLPQLALLYNKPLFPKASDPWFYLYVYLFLAAYVLDMADFCLADGLKMGTSNIARWWNDQRMWMVRGLTCFLFGTLQFVLNQAGIATQGFNVTSKVMDDEQNERYDQGVFDFGNLDSPLFMALGTAAVLSLFTFTFGLIRASMYGGVLDESLAELLMTGFIVANCWPIYEAMFFRSDGGRMASKVTKMSFVFAGLLLTAGWLVLGIV